MSFVAVTAWVNVHNSGVATLTCRSVYICTHNTLLFQVNNAETTSNSSAENNCQGELYTGMMCTSILNAISEGCDITDSETASGGVYISTQGVDQTDTETQVLLLSNGLQFLDPSPECEEAFLPFLCLFAFPLCDSSGQLYQPSFTECETVTLVTCAREWQTAVLNLGSENLPQCSSLPDTTTQCDGKLNISQSSYMYSCMIMASTIWAYMPM